MIEYAVRNPSTGGTSALERECNYMASEGWRLVSTAATAVGISVQVFLFFEREKPSRDRVEEAVATMDKEERRELMDVAVAQSDEVNR